MKKLLLFASLVFFSFTFVIAKPQFIGMKKATQIASNRVHGPIKGKELEKEHGKWIYSFDIATGKGEITEVVVDAYTSKIISVGVESAADEAKEAKEEKQKKH